MSMIVILWMDGSILYNNLMNTQQYQLKNLAIYTGVLLCTYLPYSINKFTKILVPTIAQNRKSQYRKDPNIPYSMLYSVLQQTKK